MLFKSTVTLLMASLAVAAPVKQGSILMTFYKQSWFDDEVELDVPTDGTPVPVTGNDYDTTLSPARMECGNCTQDYYCTLYDRELAPIKHLKTSDLPRWERYKIG